MNNFSKSISVLFFAAVLTLQPLLTVGQWKFDRAFAQSTTYSSPEDAFVNNNPIDSIEELYPTLSSTPPLDLSPQDINAIRDNRVDTRVINYLVYLVTPKDQGGAGLDYIKTQRILKNYDTQGTGKFDRETLAAIEEDGGIVSAHNTGQAVDISEVGAVTCKVIKKRHLGGSSTSFQGERPVKVAWQTRDGINRHPTPKGPSLFEVAGNMSAQSILLMLNESGEMDDFTDYVKGLSMGETFQYVGANILLKNYGVGDILVDPLANGVPDTLGALLLQQSIPNLPIGLPVADGSQDIREAVGRAHTEDLLNLPPGSLIGSGWDNVLASTGKRTLENALGLPALTLDKKKLKDVVNNESVKASLKHFNLDDNAFGVIPGTIDLVSSGDERSYVWAGVNLLADALRLSNDQRQKIITAVKSSEQPDVDLQNTGTDRAVSINVISSILVPEDGSSEALKDFGQKYLGQLLSKAVPNRFLGLSQEIIDSLSSSATNVVYGDLRRSIGLSKIASDSSVKSDDLDRSYSLVASVLNTQFNLSGSDSLNSDDARGLIDGSGDKAIAKLGGNQADKAIGWNSGTGLAIIEKKKTLEQGLEEVFGNSVGRILGLQGETNISLEGDLSRNYGDKIVEQRLGLSIEGDGTALSTNQQELYKAFGINSNSSLVELRKNTSFWNRESFVDSLEYIDIRLGAPIGTSRDYLLGVLSNDQLSRKIAENNLGSITKDKLLNYLDLDSTFKLSDDELGAIVSTIGDWDNSSIQSRQRMIDLGVKLMGRSLDSRSAFSKDTILSIAQSKTPDVVVNELIDQGIKQLAAAIGVNIPGFDEGDISTMARLLTNTYQQRDNGSLAQQVERQRLRGWLAQATKIPTSESADLDAFINGNIRTGLESWSAAMMVDFANKYLPNETPLTYEEMRSAINLSNSAVINKRAQELSDENGGLPSDYTESARRELMQESRDNSKYKISDAFLIQAEIPIPPNFSKVMFSGSSKDRAEMLSVAVFTHLDREIQKVRPGYVPGTLLGIFNGELDPLETNELITNIVSNNSISLGSFTSGFVGDFYSFIKADDKTTFYTDSRYDSMWQRMENWFGNVLGVSGLEPGYAKSIYHSSQNNWDFNASITQNGQVVVPSIESIGTDLVASRITNWADKNLNIPAGSTYQMYQAVNSVVSASRAVAAAKAAGDAAKLSQAQNNLSAAEAQLTVIAINIALNACEACQQFFASVDQALAAPPGFTNALVAGAIASAFGLGPAGLIAAAAIYLFGVYKVEYKCPIPPPDWYSLSQFDNPEDKIDPFTSDYYKSPDQLIKDHPREGESPFSWDNGVPFRDGDNPELWMAWSRYFTGRLLDATMSYGEAQSGEGKPLQVITYRQANVEFFAPRSAEAFGPGEVNNSKVGLGFTQKSTKTTDWVHTSFGGLF